VSVHKKVGPGERDPKGEIGDTSMILEIFSDYV
jgi:hypothetical protein